MLKRNIIYICMIMVTILSFNGCGTPEKNAEQAVSEQNNVSNQTEELSIIETEIKQEQGDGEKEHLESAATKENEVMKIKVTSKEYGIIYELNQSQAAKDLYAQLPLTLEVKDFSTNEKTFYPPEELDISDAPLANAEKGSLCYYSPWADVVMFYDYFGQGSSLYELGEVVSGKADIEKLNGTITVEIYTE